MICYDSRWVAFGIRPLAPISGSTIRAKGKWHGWENGVGNLGANLDVCLGLCSLPSAEEKHAEYFLNKPCSHFKWSVYAGICGVPGLFVLFILSLIHQICCRYLLCARFLWYRGECNMITTLKAMNRGIRWVLLGESWGVSKSQIEHRRKLSQRE